MHRVLAPAHPRRLTAGARRGSQVIGVAMATILVTAAGCSPSTPRAGRTNVDSSTVTRPTSPVPVPLPPVKEFLLQSVSFISPTTGWVFGESPCSLGRCFALFDTSDGGTSWNAATSPPFSVSPSSPSFDSATIAFADARDGWSFDTSETQVGGGTGDQLFSTHDGGTSWAPVTLGNGDQSRVSAMGDGNAHVWVITFDTVGDDFAIYGSPAPDDDFTRSTFSFPLSAGPATDFSLALQGEHGWVVENDRGVITGASLDHDAWTAWTPPCTRASGSYDDESLAGVSPTYVVALCPPNIVASMPPPTALFASMDAGRTFQMVSTDVPSATAGLAASPSGTLFSFDGQGIVASFDGGSTWQTVLGFGLSTFPYPPHAGVTFVTSAVGYATTPTGALFKTVDGGHGWRAVGLPST